MSRALTRSILEEVYVRDLLQRAADFTNSYSSKLLAWRKIHQIISDPLSPQSMMSTAAKRIKMIGFWPPTHAPLCTLPLNSGGFTRGAFPRAQRVKRPTEGRF
jgi:hypothetical protein